jgi:hypothetical protein
VVVGETGREFCGVMLGETILRVLETLVPSPSPTEPAGKIKELLGTLDRIKNLVVGNTKRKGREVRKQIGEYMVGKES